MKRAFRYLLMVFIVFCSCVVHGREHIRRDADTTFTINFFDTTYTRDVAFLLTYDDTAAKRYTLVMPTDTSVADVKDPQKGEKITMSFSYPLDLQVVEKELNIQIKTRYGVNNTITQFTVYQIFLWMYAKTTNESTVAGILRLGNYVKIHKVVNNLDYDERMNQVDLQTEELKQTKRNIEIIQNKMAIITQKIAKNTKFQKIAQDLDEARADKERLEEIGVKIENEDTGNIKKWLNEYMPGYQLKPLMDAQKAENLFIAFSLRDDEDTLKQFIATIKGFKRSNALISDLSHKKVESVPAYLKEHYDSVAVALGNNYVQISKDIKDALMPKIEYKVTNSQKEKNRLDSLIKGRDVSRYKVDTDELKRLTEDLKRIEDKLTTNGIFTVKQVDFQFERGFLENVKVVVYNGKRDVIFENHFAMGFTSKSNYRQLAFTRLFARMGDQVVHIYLSDVMRNYDNKLELFTRDYSPADTVVEVNPSKFPNIELHKATFVQLFDTKYMTDLTGLTNSQPNGLVQFEISKRVSLNTKRHPLYFDLNKGFWNYVNIFGTLNKIETTNKALILRNNGKVVNNQLVSPSYATNLDFLQYRNMTLGVELNSYVLDWPTLKSTFTIDFGAMYAHTPVKDANRVVDSSNGTLKPLRDSSSGNAHLVTFYPKFMIEVFSEKQFGFSVAYQPFYNIVLSNNLFKQVASYGKSNTDALPIEPNARWAHMIELYLRMELVPKSASKLFFRSRFYWQQGDANTFFPQIQFGYSYNVNFKKLGQ